MWCSHRRRDLDQRATLIHMMRRCGAPVPRGRQPPRTRAAPDGAASPNLRVPSLEPEADAETEALVNRILAENDLGPRDIGQAMKLIMAEHRDVVDGKTVQQLVKAKLTEK